MHSIINRSSMRLSGRWPSRNARPTSHTVRAAVAVTFLFFISDALPAPKVGGVGGKPPSGEAQILPVSLGAPSGCSGSEGRALNTAPAAADTTVGVMTYCSGPSNLPYYWRNGQWLAVGLLPGGFANGSVDGVSDLATEGGQAGPTLSGDQIGGGEGRGFVWMPGRGLMALPLINGFRWTNAAIITGDGRHVVGQNSTDTEFIAVRWSWNTNTERWDVNQLWPGLGGAVAASDDGSVVIGFGAVFLDGDSKPTSLGSKVVVGDITPAGDFIVGHQNRPCTNKPNCEYPVPVYWKLLANGSWQMNELVALDGVDSQALGVGVVNGRTIIVGWGFTKKDAIMRAVAWLPDAQGRYGAPTRLAAIEGRSKSWARARDVNGHGQVLGTSAVDGLGRAAVLWTLPKP